MNKEAETRRPTLSVIIPTLNEAQSIKATLQALGHVHGNIEVIVVDGGSDDGTTEIARRHGAAVIMSERGRGFQLNIGAGNARGEALLFLHADTTAPPEAAEMIAEALAREAAAVGGNFGIRFDGNSSAARFLTWLYPRLGKLGLSYGDSGIFVRATVYRQVGGFRSFPIFEDLDFVRRIKGLGHMVHLPATVVTSSRRFEGRSFILTFARWSILQGLYWLGISPHLLDQLYVPVRATRSRN